MEFSYRVSEQDLREAQNAISGQDWRENRGKVIVWAAIVTVLLLLWVAVHQWSNNQHLMENRSLTAVQTFRQDTEQRSFLEDGKSFVFGHGPLFPLSGLAFAGWLVWVVGEGKRKARTDFLKSPIAQGEFHIHLAREGLQVTNTAGASSSMAWNVYDHWIESPNVVVLILRSQQQFLISIRAASEQQRGELRTLLNQVLPKR